LVEQHQSAPNPRLQLALAYVDKISSRSGALAMISKAALAQRSLDQLDILLEADPSYWPAAYARAMNHLHWPRRLQHTDAAIRDFRHCLALQTRPEIAPRSYHARTYAGLGDALVKGGDFPAAYEVWQEGLQRFPGDPDLRERSALDTATDAEAFVKELRTMGRDIDTDLSFLVTP
jgi:hypothetical protein